MMLLWDEKLAFLAVPKTGSTAIEGALSPNSAILFRNPPNMKHMSLAKFVRFFDHYLKNTGINDIQTMAILREPLDWLGSWYRYRHRDEIRGNRNSTYGISFDDFILAYCQAEDRPPYANIGAQSSFISGGDTGVKVDHLFSYDRLDLAVEFLEDRVGKKLNLRQKNVSPVMELEVSPKTLAIYEQKNAEDFEIYASLDT